MLTHKIFKVTLGSPRATESSTNSPQSDNTCQLNWSMQHHLGISLFSKGGVYGASETMEAIREPADRDVESLEVGAVVS